MVFLLQQKPHKNEANLLFLNTTKSYLLYIVKRGADTNILQILAEDNLGKRGAGKKRKPGGKLCHPAGLPAVLFP